MTPEFVTAVRPLIPWARANGWEHDVYPGHYRCREFRVISDNTGWASVNDYSDLGFTRGLARFRVTSPQQAIDVLAALGVLPARFSSQWRAGRDYALTAAAVLLPDLEPVPEFVEGHHVGSRA